MKNSVNSRHGTWLRSDNVSAVRFPSAFSLSGIHQEIKLLNLQINENKYPGLKYMEFFFPGFLGVTHFYEAEDLISLLVHQMWEFAFDSKQNHWVESSSQVGKWLGLFSLTALSVFNVLPLLVRRLA